MVFTGFCKLHNNKITLLIFLLLAEKGQVNCDFATLIKIKWTQCFTIRLAELVSHIVCSNDYIYDIKIIKKLINYTTIHNN